MTPLHCVSSRPFVYYIYQANVWKSFLKHCLTLYGNTRNNTTAVHTFSKGGQLSSLNWRNRTASYTQYKLNGRRWLLLFLQVMKIIVCNVPRNIETTQVLNHVMVCLIMFEILPWHGTIIRTISPPLTGFISMYSLCCCLFVCFYQRLNAQSSCCSPVLHAVAVYGAGNQHTNEQ